MTQRHPENRSESLGERLGEAEFAELKVDLDASTGICWAWFDFHGRPSFTPALLGDIESLQSMIRQAFEAACGGAGPVKYLVWGSRMPGVWNLGGDLDLFVRLIRARDSKTLRSYAYRVVGEGYANWTALDLPIVTVALVQGDALGGGFEACLSSNMIVAEESAKFGLPEVLFSLFPGMGAYSFLSRRIAPAQAERMIMSGKLYEAAELHELGVVDLIAPDGEGEQAFLDHVLKHGGRHAAHRAIYSARDRINPVTLQEMRDITDLWVETAMTLGEGDLKKMERLVRAQNNRRQKASVDEPTLALPDKLRLRRGSRAA